MWLRVWILKLDSRGSDSSSTSSKLYDFGQFTERLFSFGMEMRTVHTASVC